MKWATHLKMALASSLVGGVAFAANPFDDGQAPGPFRSDVVPAALVVPPPPVLGSAPVPPAPPAPAAAVVPATVIGTPTVAAPAAAVSVDDLWLHGWPEKFWAGTDLVAGVGFYFIRPHWESNPAFTRRVEETTGPLTETTTLSQEFSHNYEFSPRIWLGFVAGNGVGVRARYWRFDEGGTEGTTNVPGSTGNPETVVTSAGELPLSITAPGASVSMDSQLELDVWDLEATKEMRHENWSLLGSAGVRYAHMDQSYIAVAPAPLRTNDRISESRHDFRGIGPTVAAEFRFPIWWTFTFYSSARGAILFGESERRDSRDLPGTLETIDASRDDLLGVGELEVGVECYVDIGHCRWFNQAAYVGQIWHGAGNATSEQGNLGFTGLGFMTGFQF